MIFEQFQTKWRKPKFRSEGTSRFLLTASLLSLSFSSAAWAVPVGGQPSAQITQGDWSAESSLVPSDVHLEFQTQWGVGRSPFQDSSSSPTINQMTLGVTAGFRPFQWLMLGGTADLRWTGQFSDIISSIGGVRGSRFNPFSPTLAVAIDEFTIKAEYELLGSHSFTNETSTEVLDVTYRSPRGFRVGISRPVYRRMLAGVSYESLSFESKEGNAGVPARENLWMLAFTAGWVF